MRNGSNVIRLAARTFAIVASASLTALAGCAGGMPLLHPARTLPRGDVRVAAGLSANAAVGSIADDRRRARQDAATNPNAPGTPGTDPTFARGALVAAAVGPGLAPVVAARVGVGDGYEGGIGYTGRGARIDMRHAWDLGPEVSLSVGAGVSGAFYGRQQGAALPGVDLESLHGYGADVPVLVGWEATGGLYMLWAGARAGYEHVTIEQLTSEPKPVTIGLPPTGLKADRVWGGGLVGVATGFRHVHVAIEVDVSYQAVSGEYNATSVKVHGVTVVPSSALWWDF